MKLFVSNKLEILAKRMAQVLAAPLKSPFVPETIVVQSVGMGKWVSQELARHWGICANVRLPFPQHFIQDVFSAFIPEYEPDLFYEEDTLAWSIMAALPTLLEEEEDFEPLRHYLGEEDDMIKRYQLSQRIAALFDQYTVFRPEMILAWEEGRIKKEEIWQAKIWRKINENQTKMHKARLLDIFLKKVKDAPARSEKLPPRLTIFGISYLPVYYLRIFDALSRHLEIYFFYLNPSPEFWGDIASEKEAGKLLWQGSWETLLDEEIMHLDRGNPLLASWGAAGRDFFRLITRITDEVEELFSEPEENNLLTSLQADVYHLRDRGQSSVKEIAADDASVQFHACHSPLREVEVLHDVLLELFEKKPHLLPKDILVMTPSIEEYAPYIEAVFSSRKPQIPYTIADRGLTGFSPILKDLFSVLNMDAGRFSAADVLSFLDNPAVVHKFGLSASDTDLIREWVKNTRICWGIDGSHRQELGLSGFDQNTWQAGLMRLKLGYAMAGKREKMFGGILPYDDIEGQSAMALGRFCDFFELLVRIRKDLSSKRNLRDWADLLSAVVDELFADHEAYRSDLFYLNHLLVKMKEQQRFFKEDFLLDVGVIRRYLASALAEHRGSADYLAGSVTFCAMLPMRSIPFPVIALIGMNDDGYPRRENRLSFDLMQKRKRIGDRSARNDDRYLFLESLLSARESVVISYVGRQIKDHQPLSPSVLVGELKDYIDRSFRVGDAGAGKSDKTSERLTREHHLHPFHPDYYRKSGPLFSYSKENLAAARAEREETAQPIFCQIPAENVRAEERLLVTLDELRRFFKKPVQYFLEKKLLMKLPEEDVIVNEEPFELDPLNAYQIKEELLALERPERADMVYRIRRAEGILPHGAVGDFYFRREKQKIEDWKRRYGRYFCAEKIAPLEIDLAIGGCNLVGRIDGIFESFHLLARPAKLKGGDYLSAWIDHLLLNYCRAEGDPPTTILIGEDNGVALTEIENAREHLEDLIWLFLQGQSRPLKLFSQTSMAYAKSLCEKGDPDAAWEEARKCWWGDRHNPSEAEEIQNIICFGGQTPLDEEFQGCAEKTFKVVFENIEKLGTRESP